MKADCTFMCILGNMPGYGLIETVFENTLGCM